MIPKFRAWNWEEILEVVELLKTNDWTWLYILSDESRVCSCWKETCIYPWKIMQFTWLLDKEWTDIYTSDIVELFQTCHWTIQTEVKQEQWEYRLYGDKWRFWTFADIIRTDWIEMKIIWNIHQQPNLINK